MKTHATIMAIFGTLSAGVAPAFPSYTPRYRLIVEVDTPGIVRSSSSVIQPTRKDFQWVVLIGYGRNTFSMRGEAVFAGLGASRNVAALLVDGPRAENVDQMISPPIEAYECQVLQPRPWCRHVFFAATGMSRLQFRFLNQLEKPNDP